MSPCEYSFAICLPLYELSLICVPVYESLITTSMSFVILPLALIHSPIVVYYNSFAVALPIAQLSLIYSVLVLFDAIVFTGLDYLIVELVTFHVILKQMLLFLRKKLLLLLFSALWSSLISSSLFTFTSTDILKACATTIN